MNNIYYFILYVPTILNLHNVRIQKLADNDGQVAGVSIRLYEYIITVGNDNYLTQ